MKKISLVLAVFSVIFISACKDDEQGTNPQGNDGYVQMKTSVDTMNVKMDNMQMTMDPDYDFAMMMVPHHEGAIELAKIIIQNGHHGEIKQLAQDIITSQTASINKLKQYMGTHTPMHDMMDSMYMHQMDMSMMQMKADFDTVGRSDDADVNFAKFMIIHHQGAIDMARATVEHSMGGEMMTEANNEITEQQQQIQQMKDFLNNHKQ